MPDNKAVIVPLPKPVNEMTDEERKDFARLAVKKIREGLRRGREGDRPA